MGVFRYGDSHRKVTIDPSTLAELIRVNRYDMVDDASVRVDFQSDESVRVQIKEWVDDGEDFLIAAIFIKRDGTFDASGNNAACTSFLQFVKNDLKERCGKKVSLFAKSTSDDGYAEDASVMGDSEEQDAADILDMPPDSDSDQ